MMKVVKKNEKTCNCARDKTCPLNGKCLEKGIVYKARVKSTEEGEKEYNGLTAIPFKDRLKVHTYLFRHKNTKTPTELTRYIWKLDNENKNWSITWELVGYGKTFEPGDKFCQLCNREKTEIIMVDREKAINSMNIIENVGI